MVSEFIKKKIEKFLPSFICFIILGIIYYFNNLYPFGIKSLVQVDADYIYIPTLYKIWDFLHYGGSLFYDNIGFGNSIYGSLIIQGSLYSPLNLLLYFVDRNSIVNFFGIFIIIKICLISLTCYIFINYKYKNINYFYKVLFSVLYAFSGFVIFNYFNEIWLDIVILFPILVLYLDKLLVDDKELGYIVILSLSLIITFYFTYFVIIFILFYTFIYIYLYKKDNIKETIFKLGKSTVIALLISSFSSIPLIYQILISARFNTEHYTSMLSSLNIKILYLLFSPLFIILFLKLVSKFKNDQTRIYGYVILFILYFIPVIIDPINALLHGGDYWDLPYRYGFITLFILMDGSLYYINNFLKEKNNKVSRFDIIYLILIIGIGIYNVYLNFMYRNVIITSGILLKIKDDIFKDIIYMVVIVFFMYVITLLIKNKYFKYISLSIVSLFSIFLFTSWTIYYNSGYYLCNNAQNYIINNKLYNDGRYKIDYRYVTPYIGYIYNINTLDNWIHILPDGEADTYERLGYLHSGSSMYSVGGTIFSDYLLNYKYTFSDEDTDDDDMYDLVSIRYGKYLYKYNYDNAYGMVLDELNDIEYNDKFDYQNKIYRSMFNTDKDIIKYYNYGYDDMGYIKLNFNIEAEGYLYFDTKYYENVNQIKIGDKYISNFDNYIKYLGCYNNDVEIEIYLNNSYYFDFNIGFIEKEDIIKLSSIVQYKNDTYYVDSDSEKYLFLPINNIDGIHVYNNDKEVKTYKYLDNFIGIKLNKGNNNIKISYKLPLFNVSIILSIIGMALLIINKKIIPNKIILNICYYLYICIVLCVFLYFYLYSLFKYVI